jgi:ankyrin repeat protein
MAAGMGQEDVVKLLLDIRKVHIDVKDSDGRTPLLWAAGNGYAAVAKLLLDIGKFDMDVKDSSSCLDQFLLCTARGREGEATLFRALFLATQKGQEEAVQLLRDTLLANTFAEDTKDSLGPLMSVPGMGQEAVDKLLPTGKVDIDAMGTKHRLRPFSWVAGSVRETLVKVLVAFMPNIDPKHPECGLTPLSRFVMMGHDAVAKLLAVPTSFVGYRESLGRVVSLFRPCGPCCVEAG